MFSIVIYEQFAVSSDIPVFRQTNCAGETIHNSVYYQHNCPSEVKTSQEIWF